MKLIEAEWNPTNWSLSALIQFTTGPEDLKPTGWSMPNLKSSAVLQLDSRGFPPLRVWMPSLRVWMFGNIWVLWWYQKISCWCHDTGPRCSDVESLRCQHSASIVESLAWTYVRGFEKDADVFNVAVGHGAKVLLESRKWVNKLFCSSIWLERTYRASDKLENLYCRYASSLRTPSSCTTLPHCEYPNMVGE